MKQNKIKCVLVQAVYEKNSFRKIVYHNSDIIASNSVILLSKCKKIGEKTNLHMNVKEINKFIKRERTFYKRNVCSSAVSMSRKTCKMKDFRR